jgi:hypothetical protein
MKKTALALIFSLVSVLTYAQTSYSQKIEFKNTVRMDSTLLFIRGGDTLQVTLAGNVANFICTTCDSFHFEPALSSPTIPTYTVENGLTFSNDSITLGGHLTRTTVITNTGAYPYILFDNDTAPTYYWGFGNLAAYNPGLQRDFIVEAHFPYINSDSITTIAADEELNLSAPITNVQGSLINLAGLDSAAIDGLTPAAGYFIYCTDCTGNGLTGRLLLHDGTAWRRLSYE